MSRLNISTCDNKSLGNFVNSEKVLNLAEMKDLRKVPNVSEFMSRNRMVINNDSHLEKHSLPPNCVYDMNDEKLIIKKTCGPIENKKLMNVTFDNDSNKCLTNLSENNDETNYEMQRCLPDLVDTSDNEAIPLVNIYKYNKNIINNSQNVVDPYRDSLPTNRMYIRKFVSDVPDIPAIASISTTYNNFNGYHPQSRLKNATAYGSSFINNVPPQALFSHQNTQSIDNSDFRNHHKQMKSQNVYFVDQNIDPDFVNVNHKKINLKKDNINNVPMVNNQKILIPCSTGRKEAILIQQPECYDAEMYPNMTEIVMENVGNHSTIDSNEVAPSVLRDNLISLDCIYPNNCYGAQFPIYENRKNIPYQQMPLQLIPVQGSVVLNTNTDFRNAYPHYCLAPIPSSYVAYSPADKTKLRNIVPSEQTIKPTPTAPVAEPVSIRHKSVDESHAYYTNFIPKPQPHQFSSNNELNRGGNNLPPGPSVNESVTPQVSFADPAVYSNVTLQQNSSINDPVKMPDLQTSCVPISTNCTPNGPIQKIGKFSVTPVSTDATNSSPARSTTGDLQNIPTHLHHHAYVGGDDIPKLDRPQQNSRFKKTRIRETVERWCMNGLNTYDCRIKDIPSKIMNLYDSKPDYFSKEMDMNQSCARCETHDKEKYCYDVDYIKKEFKFWHNGNHVDLLCHELEENVDNYCQFHAKILKLLNQNQNLSLSKCSNNLFDFSENTNVASPQIFQTVLISSPEHDNYIINIDTQASHVLLSAPPVSPSIMNTASVSSLPTNIQSPRSATTMVMLKCATPVLLSSATRNATLLNESISIEKINHKASPNIAIDSDSNSICGQHIMANDNAPLIDLWQSSPIKSDQLAFKLSSPTYVAGTVIADNSTIQADLCNHQHSLYSIGHMSPIYYPIYQQPRSSMSSTMIGNKCHDHTSSTHLANGGDQQPSSSALDIQLPSDLIEEINNSTNLFKSMITSIFLTERGKLLNEIEVLRKSNEQLANELSKVKSRSDQLEKIIKNKQDPSSESYSIDQGSVGFHTDSEPSITDFHQPELDCNNLI